MEKPTPSRLFSHLEAGGTVYVSTHLRTTPIKQKHATAYANADMPIFKKSGGSLYMAKGSKYVCIDGCKIALA